MPLAASALAAAASALALAAAPAADSRRCVLRFSLAPAFSPQGRLAVTDGSSVWVTDANLRRPRRLTRPLRRSIASLSWSPDGTKIAVVSVTYIKAIVSGSRLDLVAADGSRRQVLLDYPFADYTITWSPDSRVILVGSQAVPAAGGTPVRVTPEGAIFPSWSPTANLVAYYTTRGLEVAEPGGAGARVVVPSVHFTLRPPVWSPDGARLALVQQFADSRTRIGVAEVASGRWRLVTPYGTDHPAWAPDGSALVYERRVNDVHGSFLGTVLDTIALTDTGEAPPAGIVDDLPRWSAHAPVWSPDGRTIAFTSIGRRRVHVRLVDSGGGRERDLVAPCRR